MIANDQITQRNASNSPHIAYFVLCFGHQLLLLSLAISVSHPIFLGESWKLSCRGGFQYDNAVTTESNPTIRAGSPSIFDKTEPWHTFLESDSDTRAATD